MLKLKNMNEKRFVDHDTSVEDYVESLENRNTKEKTKRDVKLLETFLRNEKNDERDVQDIEPAELNKHLYSSLFVLWDVKTERGLWAFKFKMPCFKYWKTFEEK